MNGTEPRKNRRVHLLGPTSDLPSAVREALSAIGVTRDLSPSTRVAIKPNLTYPYYKPGVTTAPAVLEAIIQAVKDYTNRIAVVETDGGYGAWAASEAFAGHDLPRMRLRYGIDVVNLCEEPAEDITFSSGGRTHRVPLPTRLLDATDVFLTVPVPKIHCMTGVSLSFKNQWGCVPDTMRLRRHYVFDDAIVAINRALRPKVLADGTYFLDGNGPMDGTAVKMGLIIAATDPGAFDRYVSELMGIPWRRIRHFRAAAAAGEFVEDLVDISCNVGPTSVTTHKFRLRRSLRNNIALLAFRSRGLTWLGYESWLGRVVLHGMLYAVAGRPVNHRSR